jgi:hypothetical protein
VTLPNAVPAAGEVLASTVTSSALLTDTRTSAVTAPLMKPPPPSQGLSKPRGGGAKVAAVAALAVAKSKGTAKDARKSKSFIARFLGGGGGGSNDVTAIDDPTVGVEGGGEKGKTLRFSVDNKEASYQPAKASADGRSKTTVSGGGGEMGAEKEVLLKARIVILTDVVAVVALGVVMNYAMGNVMINGPVYRRIMVLVDLLIDIYPPPLSLIEPMPSVLLLANERNPLRQRQFTLALSESREAFNNRIIYWKQVAGGGG